MKIAILFYEKERASILGETVNVHTFDEMKDAIKSKMEDSEFNKFWYNWDEDSCACGVGLGEDPSDKYETDIDKMLDMVVERIGKFGWCFFEGMFGEYERVFVCDTESEGGKKWFN